MVVSAKLRRLNSSSMIWRRWVTESSSSATQTSSHHRETVGSTTRECVRRKAASFKSANVRQPHWHRHLDVKRPTRAVEELHQVAATRTERRLISHVDSV